MSLQDLESQLAAVGRRISFSGLSKVERGERRVEVDDLMAIALCLDVPPNTLLLPAGAVDDIVEVTGLRASLGLLWEWALAADVGVSTDDTRSFQARSLPGWLEVTAELGVADGYEAILGVVRRPEGWVERQVLRGGVHGTYKVTELGDLVQDDGEHPATS